MKKMVALTLALCMALSLAGCGGGSASTPAPSAANDPVPSAQGEALDPTYTAEKPLVLKFTWAGTAHHDRGQAFPRKADSVAHRSADFTCDYGCPDMMLCNIFYTFDSVEKTLQFSDSDIFQSMCDKVAEGGIKVLNLAWIEAPRQLMTTKPVQSFADLKGMKIRVPSFVYTDYWEG